MSEIVEGDYAKAAKEVYAEEGVIEFDAEPKVSHSPGGGGAYVAAWVWVSNEQAELWKNEKNENSGG